MEAADDAKASRKRKLAALKARREQSNLANAALKDQVVGGAALEEAGGDDDNKSPTAERLPGPDDVYAASVFGDPGVDGGEGGMNPSQRGSAPPPLVVGWGTGGLPSESTGRHSRPPSQQPPTRREQQQHPQPQPRPGAMTNGVPPRSPPMLGGPAWGGVPNAARSGARGGGGLLLSPTPPNSTYYTPPPPPPGAGGYWQGMPPRPYGGVSPPAQAPMHLHYPPAPISQGYFLPGDPRGGHPPPPLPQQYLPPPSNNQQGFPGMGARTPEGVHGGWGGAGGASPGVYGSHAPWAGGGRGGRGTERGIGAGRGRHGDLGGGGNSGGGGRGRGRGRDDEGEGAAGYYKPSFVEDPWRDLLLNRPPQSPIN